MAWSALFSIGVAMKLLGARGQHLALRRHTATGYAQQHCTIVQMLIHDVLESGPGGVLAGLSAASRRPAFSAEPVVMYL